MTDFTWLTNITALKQVIENRNGIMVLLTNFKFYALYIYSPWSP